MAPGEAREVALSNDDIEDRLQAVIHGDGLDEAEEMALLSDALGTIRRRRQDIKDQTEWASEVINAVVEHVGASPRDYEDGVTAADIRQALADHNDEFERESERLQSARAEIARLQALNAQLLDALADIASAAKIAAALCDDEDRAPWEMIERRARSAFADAKPAVKESLTTVEGDESHD